MQTLTNGGLTRWQEFLDAMLRAYDDALFEVV